MWAFLRALDEEEPHPRLWALSWRRAWATAAAEEPDRGGISGWRGGHLSLADAAACFRARTWKRLHPVSGAGRASADCRAVAHPGNDPQSTVFCLRHCTAARVSITDSVVLLNQRAAAALPEPALSARLQHRAAAVFLAVSSDLAVSVERVSACGREAFVQANGPCGTDSFAGVVLDRIRADLLHVFDDAGVLLDAVLSGVRAALIGSAMASGSRDVGAARYARAGGDLCGVAAMAAVAIFWHVRDLPTPGDISRRAARASERVHAFPRPHGGPDDASFAYLRVPLADRGDRVPDRRRWRTFRRKRGAHISRRPDDGFVFPRGADGDGGFRSVSVIAADRGGADAFAAGHFDHRIITTIRILRCSSIRTETACF